MVVVLTLPENRQCQMNYEKNKQRKKAQMNLEKCRYYRLWQFATTLDSTQKNCCRLFTDGEELKNSQIFSVDYSSVAVLLRAIKGKSINAQPEALLLVAGLFTFGFESKNSQRLRRFASSRWFVVQGRLEAAIFRAYFQHLLASPLR